MRSRRVGDLDGLCLPRTRGMGADRRIIGKPDHSQGEPPPAEAAL
jgi:hypothetical protein